MRVTPYPSGSGAAIEMSLGMSQSGRKSPGRRAPARKGKVAVLAAIAVIAAFLVPVTLAAPASAANTVGQGFSVTPSDLAYILKQIKIAEAHVANTTSQTGPCGALLGTGSGSVTEHGGSGLLGDPDRPRVHPQADQDR